jgi:geranyl-CoA carboxylase alpha subunit
MSGFNSILVANRGEIACRLIRSARDLGYRTIAVYSEADAEALHVALADEAALLGPAPAGESYLDIERILEAAQRTGARAVHPGYGFLSENADFARACEAAGLVFIGPPADAIELMGNKAAARRHMEQAGIACIPGYEGPAQNDAALLAAAGEVGFPIMVKAAAGGGGRGMRLVADREVLPDALRQARAEAASAFGSDELILERAILRPRHVEFQVFADRHGNVVHLGERDCSVQRRHQKVVEESPCPVMTPELRDRMGAVAVEAARSIGYVGAGTVEFLLGESGDFWFLEMNTRLQVEHPVTELVTGLDLVALQIAVAQGEVLPVVQDDVSLRGHAIEVRLYAEDTEQDFMPSTGPVDLWRPPAGEGIRVDHGIKTGGEITPFYDAMVAKLIAWGPSRETARLRLVRALRDSALFGPRCNRDYLIRVLEDETFARGEATTAFIGETELQAPPPTFRHAATAAVLDLRQRARQAQRASACSSPVLMNWSNSGRLVSYADLAGAYGDISFEITTSGSAYEVSDRRSNCNVEVLHDDGVVAEISVDGASHKIIYCHPGDGVTWLALGGSTERFVNRASSTAAEDETGEGGHIRSPMHGQLLEICVAEGDTVSRGQRLLVLEAMKMQHEIQAAASGTVSALHFQRGEQVAAGALILEIDAGENPEKTDISESVSVDERATQNQGDATNARASH